MQAAGETEENGEEKELERKSKQAEGGRNREETEIGARCARTWLFSTLSRHQWTEACKINIWPAQGGHKRVGKSESGEGAWADRMIDEWMDGWREGGGRKSEDGRRREG